MRFSYVFGAILSALCVNAKSGGGRSDLYIHALKHDIQALAQHNWDSKVGAARATTIHVVIYYKKSAEAKALIQGELNDLATMAKGMAVVGAVDCDVSPKLCKDHQVTTFPQVLVWPVLPFPASPWTEKIDKSKLMSHINRMIPSAHITVLTSATYMDWLEKDPSVPKVILTSSKKNPPPVYRALSNKFVEAMRFGFVSGTETELAERVGGKKLPSLKVHRHNKPDEVYASDKFDYTSLFNWINVYAETFAAGGGYAATSSGEEKPWRFQSLPEMTIKSHQDICFKGSDKGLCLILINKAPVLSDEHRAMLEELKEKYRSHLDGRGTEFRYMWMNGANETEFVKGLKLEQSNLPAIVVFNPHKRMRYITTPSDKPATITDAIQLVDKIMGGDARFTVIPKQKLPAFAPAQDATKIEL